MTNPKNKSFIIHKDSLSVLKKLSVEQKAGLFDAISNYQLQSELPADNFISIIFEPFLNQFKRDEEKWLNVVDRNKQNIAKRWNTKNTTGKSGIPDDTKNTDSDSKSDSDNKKDSKNKKDNKKGFTPPTLEEVKNYCNSIVAIIDPQEFIDYYKSNGWKVGKNAMKDWEATIRSWNSKAKKNPQGYQSFKVSKPSAIDTYNALAEKYAREDLENGE
jgi:hypothetical protein